MQGKFGVSRLGHGGKGRCKSDLCTQSTNRSRCSSEGVVKDCRNSIVLKNEAHMEMLQIIFERSDSLNGYWNLYIAVSLGILGLMASAKPFTQLRTTKFLLTVAFIAFAISNGHAMYDINDQRRELIELVETPFTAVVAHGRPPGRVQFVAFHAVLDLLVVLCIWLIPWCQLRKNAA